jgi:hypothetical protein
MQVNINGIITIVVGGLTLAVLGWIAGIILKFIRKFNNRLRLIEIKQDCFGIGMRSVNSGIGEQFGNAFDDHFETIMKEEDFKNDK